MEVKTFEEKLSYAQEILEKLSDPETTLENAVKLYEEGMKNLNDAQRMLEEAKAKVETIRTNYVTRHENDDV